MPQQGAPDLRGYAWHLLWRQLHEERLTLSGHEADIYRVRFAPNGRWLATAGKDQTARVWDANTGQCLHVFSGHKGEVNAVAFCPIPKCSLRPAMTARCGFGTRETL